jgi:putative transposase
VSEARHHRANVLPLEKKEYGGLRVDQAKRLKGLEQENLRLKRMVADQALDLSILKEVASGNF